MRAPTDAGRNGGYARVANRNVDHEGLLLELQLRDQQAVAGQVDAVIEAVSVDLSMQL